MCAFTRYDDDETRMFSIWNNGACNGCCNSFDIFFEGLYLHTGRAHVHDAMMIVEHTCMQHH